MYETPLHVTPPEAARPRRHPLRFFASAARGTEGPLRDELVGLGAHAPTGDRGGVFFEGTLETGMRACVHCRTAMRVLLEIGRFEAEDERALYEGSREVTWADHISVRSTFAVRATVRDATITHSGYAALKVKDAIADALRDRFGARPDVDPHDPDVGVVLHLRGTSARLFLDMAGESLHRRGYRVDVTEAPLKETLAAAILKLGRVDAELPFVDPMAGSGTFAIEHALAVRRRAPGLGRSFGFERWPSFTPDARAAFAELKREAEAAVLARCPAPIVCADRDEAALAAARANASRAGVEQDIEFRRAELRELAPAWPRGTAVSNPPYGERLAAPEYRELARALEALHGYRLVLLAGNPELAHSLRYRPQVSHRLWNGNLEVRLLCYEIPTRRITGAEPRARSTRFPRT